MNLFERHARLNQLFQQTPVEAAYLSGTLTSRAAFGELTDVDIAILLAEQIATDQFLDYQLFFLAELTQRLDSEALDVVILNQASLLLRLQVIKYGQILYSRDDRKRGAFESRTVMDYLDFRQMDDLQHQALSRRLRAPAQALDSAGIHAGLARIETAVTRLSEPLPAALDERERAVVERALLLSIEAVAQVATLLYAGLGISQPEAYGELLTPLVKRGLLPAEVASHVGTLLAARDTLLRAPERLTDEAARALVTEATSSLLAFADHARRAAGDAA